jgi:L-iditol 2-dehydrogenase
VIVEKGKKVRSDLNIGDRVAYMYYFCGECDACRSGNTGDCINFDIPKFCDGYYGFFGFADYNVKDARLLIKMNKALPADQAAFLEPVATVIHGIRRLKLKSMENVAVIGAGTMGLINAQIARLFGSRVFITELMEKKIERARQLGFREVVDVSKDDPITKIKDLTDGKGADAVIIAVGSTKANQQALEMLKKLRGKILFFAAGFPIPKLEINSNIIHYRKMELIGTYGADVQDFYESAKLLNQGFIDVVSLLEAKFPLTEIQKAFEVASMPGNYRVTVSL